MSDPAPITSDTLDLARLQKPQGHKYDHGHALVLTGGAGRTGAARLAAMAALRIGAGAVTLGVPPAAQMEVAMQITALMLRRIGSAEDLAQVLRDPRINALCLGPGFGLSDERRYLIEVALKSGRALVLDADALTLIAGDPALFALLHEKCVLTPHGGEFRRLFPGIARDTAQGTQQAAEQSGAVVLQKGADTFIAHPDGRCLHHAATGTRAVPWLATAGAGDTLAGFITGLLSRGFAGADAAALSTFLHVECARHFGPGLIAEDLADQLPAVLRAMLPPTARSNPSA